MATVFGSAQDFQQAQQDPHMQFTSQQAHLNLHANHPVQQGFQQNHQYAQPIQQPHQRAVYFPPRDSFRTRNPTCFWVLIIIVALIVVTIISSFITYLMLVWQVNENRVQDWDKQYGPDRWDPNKIPHHH